MVALSTVIAMSVNTLGCGYILYPNRRGNHGGSIDGATLVMDCLWLLAGIVPGVVFLIVDFSTGAMYVGGGGGAGVSVRVSARGTVAIPLNDSAEAKTLRLQLVTESKRVLDDKTAVIGPTRHNQSVELNLGRAATTNEKLFLRVVDAKNPTVVLQSVQIARATPPAAAQL